jgi:hypothetical protein
MSYRKIVKELKEMGHTVSIGVINRIQHSKGFIRSNIRNSVKIGPFKKQRTAATDEVIRKIRNMIRSEDPPTQRQMAKNKGYLSQQLIVSFLK